MKIAALGPKGTFSEQAANQYMQKIKEKGEIIFCNNLPEVFDFVQKKKADLGIAPLENLLDGSLGEVLDLLYHSSVYIDAEIILAVHHCIASLSLLSEIKTVISRPQALAQCLSYIRKNKFSTMESLSTAEAMKIVAEKKLRELAAIGPESAANEYGLKILQRNIEDKDHNVTRFIVISRNRNGKEVEKEYKTSIVIHPTKDRPGLLYKLLKSFATRNINLTKIESRPTKLKLGDYIFHIDFEGHEEDEKVKEAFSEIRKIARIKILGSYERIK
nr:prephenate dehydratase [uncultured archaeon]